MRVPQGGVGASIFDYGSPMGLIPGELEDHWVRDLTTATWTRSIVVPRRDFYHPSEGEGGVNMASAVAEVALCSHRLGDSAWAPPGKATPRCTGTGGPGALAYPRNQGRADDASLIVSQQRAASSEQRMKEPIVIGAFW